MRGYDRDAELFNDHAGAGLCNSREYETRLLRAHHFHDRDESPAQEQGDQKRMEKVLTHVSAANLKRRSPPRR